MANDAGTDGAQAKMRAEQGFDMVSVVTDLGGLEAGMMRQLEAAKGAGEGGRRDGY